MSAREAILGRLKAAPARPGPPLPSWTPPTYPDKTARFRQMAEASHAEIHDVTAADWPARLATILGNRGVRSLMVAPGTARGDALMRAAADGVPLPPLVAYDRAVEELKDALVHQVDAGLTGTLGGIAETGTLILWPTAQEPRLLSLLPPLHIAVLEEDTLHDTLAAAVRDGGWAAGMPTNALLISGPSKTSDIEQTLAYGVHGPKELIILLVKKEGE
ncbi:LutC/YkgG family protein [Nitrospirillum iridis]|uniref:L-lactate dehydrogenase complex protein LldG n=1 Tax=Nitrospirillum iridis TaxID=765888 RepID=A0A7X0EDS3_9PROT|nr:LUD domain-containing protein [Nitrospirillum iridis]MBB6250709.1 L-lactate dehydrogenase complex protein LldG [Nitrospirillum iridis]